MEKFEFDKNVGYIDDCDYISVCSKGPVWKDKPFSVELEMYTNAGGDMIVTLEELSKECLQKYIEDFDVNEEVLLWWEDGIDAAHKKGVPFWNIKEHYEDLEDWLKDLLQICNEMPY